MMPALSAKLVLISVKVKLAALAGPLSDRIAAAAVVGGNAFIFRPSSVLDADGASRRQPLTGVKMSQPSVSVGGSEGPSQRR